MRATTPHLTTTPTANLFSGVTNISLCCTRTVAVMPAGQRTICLPAAPPSYPAGCTAAACHAASLRTVFDSLVCARLRRRETTAFLWATAETFSLRHYRSTPALSSLHEHMFAAGAYARYKEQRGVWHTSRINACAGTAWRCWLHHAPRSLPFKTRWRARCYRTGLPRQHAYPKTTPHVLLPLSLRTSSLTVPPRAV